MTLLHPSVEHHLQSVGASYQVMECDPAFADTAAFCARYGISPDDSANTILVASKRPPGKIAACIALATTRLDVNKAVRDEMQVKKLSFASADQTLEASGMEIGGVTPFGLPPDISVLVDRAVMTRPTIVLGGGNRASKLRLTPDQLELIETVRIVDGLAAPI
jgi:prolyl-tRNA editing enzyme YbaK/EbsC (Cys-tRNA(Pro) deacylase)